MLPRSGLKAACLLSLSLYSFNVWSASFDVKDFEVYYDTRQANEGDIYLHSKELFVPIGIDIMVPIILPSKGTVYFDKDQNEIVSTSITDQTASELTVAIEQTHYLYEDVNTDGVTDVRVYSLEGDGSGIVFYGSHNSDIPTAVAFSFSSAPPSTQFGSSSQLAASHPGVKVFTASESNIDVVSLAPPNFNGVSVNNFTQFSSSDRPIRIVNSPGVYNRPDGSQGYRYAAETIVVSAENIELVNNIEVVGVSADIIFVTTGASGKISCDNCRFNNIGRLSLINAKSTSLPHMASYSIGAMEVSSGGQVVISNLYAPGIVALDILTNELSLQGKIDTHQKVNQHGVGLYSPSESGDKVMGAGQANILLGENTWDYETQAVLAVKKSGTFDFTGEIYSLAVNLSASGDLNFNGYIDTRADVVSTIPYKYGVFVPTEAISINALGESNLHIYSDMISSGAVTLNSTNNVYFHPFLEPLNGKNINVIAKNTVQNDSLLKGQVVTIAAAEVINQGQIT